MNEWDEIYKQIERSEIKRFPWKKLLGMTLTELISQLKNQGYTSKETLKAICNNKSLRNFCGDSIQRANKMHKRIKISVCARYGEQNASERRKEMRE